MNIYKPQITPITLPEGDYFFEELVVQPWEEDAIRPLVMVIFDALIQELLNEEV